MPLDGNPDAGLLADKTTLNSDLKGVPTGEQFNPPSLTYTETTMRSLAHSIPPPFTAPTQSVRYDKNAQPGTGTLMERTILNRDLAEDSTDLTKDPSSSS